MTPETAIMGPVGEKGADFVPLPAVTPLPAAPPVPSLEKVREFVRASKAENTLRGYQCDWRQFSDWCEVRKLAALPASPETVASYIAECAGRLKRGCIQRRLHARAEAHKTFGVESP